MNSVISAFKTKKNSSNSSSNSTGAMTTTTATAVATSEELKQKQNGGSIVGLSIASVGGVTRKKPVAQDNGYQYLRQIREIETANKLLSPVALAVTADDLHTGSELLNFRPAAVDAIDGGADVVDHCAPAMVRLSCSDAHSDYNMNGKTISSSSLSSINGKLIENGNGNLDSCGLTCDDDDNSEHSTAACNSTSSSSEHSNSTVVHSPTVVAAPATTATSTAQPSSSSSCSLSASPSSGAEQPLAVVCPENGGAQTPLASPVLSQGHHEDYVPAFLKAPPVTLPLSSSSNNSSSLSSCCSSISNNTTSNTPAISSAASTPKHTRYSKPRLSLSRGFNHSMPSVHGRPNLSVAPPNGAAQTNGQANGQPPKRISTHQRNLSLDFRSMGILLPPVSQVTNTRINHTQHHRNRSLDSALQRIPEVEISSPNAENEPTFCSPSSILSTNMCSKIVTTAASVTAALSTSPPMPAISSQAVTTNPTIVAACNKPATETPPVHTASAAIVDACPTLRMRPKSSESMSSRSQDIVGVIGGNTGGCNSSSNSCSSAGSSKKREDLTSLGSDDSGIICGSESDQISLNRICHSHESLDSGEMDADGDADADGEEECIDMMDTTSMDEDYNLMQSDLCFYPPPPHAANDFDCRTLRPSRKQKQQKREQAKLQLEQQQQEQQEAEQRDVDARMRYRVMNMSQAAINLELGTAPNEIEPVLDEDEHEEQQEEQKETLPAAAQMTTTTTTNTPTTTPVATPTPIATPTESTKNDQVLFKNFFGATKNAIFRTAQSIIENHEKKNAAKQKTGGDDTPTTTATGSATPTATTPQDQVKSPTDISKKKEFFSLLTSNSSKKAAAAAAAASASAAATPTAATEPTAEESKGVAEEVKIKERTLNLRLPGAEIEDATLLKSSSISSLHKHLQPVPGVVKYFISERAPTANAQQSAERGPSGLLRFFESPVFNIHFAVHYLFYSKEPGVLSFIGNKIFSFPDHVVDLYIPQLIVMYIQMDELAEVLDPYLTIRCRKSVDFSLKCLWLLEAYNYQLDTLGTSSRKSKLALMKEIFSKREQKQQTKSESARGPAVALVKKTHHRSQSDATVLLTDSRSPHTLSISHRMYQQPPYTTQTLPSTPAKLCLGDLNSGRAFDNGCTCFETVRGQVNGLLGQRTLCSCGAPRTAPQKEFMKALMNVGKNLTALPSKAEKTSALRMSLNLINKNLPARVWLPLYSDIPHHVVRITEEKTAVLNSKDKTPYIIYVEVVEVPDIYTSPLIPKMMPTLRHTKSEEHLDGGCLQAHHQSCSRTSSCSSSHHGSSCRRKKAAENSAENGCGEPASHNGNCGGNLLSLGGLQLQEDDVWSQEDDEITAQYLHMRKNSERDAISQMSLDSCDSRDQGPPVVFNIGDVRTRHCNNLNCENTKSFSNDPEDPSAAALKEPWDEKEKLIRESSPYGHLSSWRLLSAIVKCGDDLRQELMATQLLQMFKIIWLEEQVDLWVRPYKIICLSNDSGLIEPILNTVSLHQIKKNSNKSLRDYFIDEYGTPTGESFRRAQKNFVQSCAAYCLISYLLQVKDRHNGNILFHSDGHIIHIDFGFILSISPKNLGFEQSPFKLTHEFVDVMGGTSSEHWREFNRLLLVGMMSARKHMDRIINFVEIMRSNAQLPCFKNGCSGTVQNLRKRFHMNLTEQEMERKVEQLVQDSLKSLSTKLYDGYQYYTNGIL
ncbi:platelet binding protein GspB isoform X2 [Drosophila nasuta]|uniref:platelet binding protein GspB isoform X2 n=1 Tax=Drosophila nasuta TaxID=42062 RepID=UPI00295ED8F8|nr:platelet binding protein GspB isoform X2 [Drosophila nasuta]